MLRLPVKHVNNVVSPDTFILCAGANIDITILIILSTLNLK